MPKQSRRYTCVPMTRNHFPLIAFMILSATGTTSSGAPSYVEASPPNQLSAEQLGGAAETPSSRVPPRSSKTPRSADARSKQSLSKMVTEYNKTLPMLVAPHTELMDMAAEEGMLIYNNRLVDVNVRQDQVDATGLFSPMKPLVVNAACADPQMRDLLKGDVTLRYRYYDKDRRYIGSFDVKPSDCRAAKSQAREFLSKIASDTNKTLPMVVDKDTELMNLLAADEVLIYSYRLINVFGTEFDSDEFVSEVKPIAINAACTTPQTRDYLLKLGIRLRHRYYDKDHHYIASFEVKQSDCGR